MQNDNLVWSNCSCEKYCLVKKTKRRQEETQNIPDTIMSEWIFLVLNHILDYFRVITQLFWLDDKSELCMNYTILWLEKLRLTNDLLDTEEALLVDDGLAVHKQHQTRQRVDADATSEHRLVLRVCCRYSHLSHNRTLLNKLGEVENVHIHYAYHVKELLGIWIDKKFICEAHMD